MFTFFEPEQKYITKKNSESMLVEDYDEFNDSNAHALFLKKFAISKRNK